MRKYFDENGLQVLTTSMQSKKIQCTCPTCNNLISGKVASCSSCKKRYHTDCEYATPDDLNRKKWRCNSCIKINTSKVSKKI